MVPFRVASRLLALTLTAPFAGSGLLTPLGTGQSPKSARPCPSQRSTWLSVSAADVTGRFISPKDLVVPPLVAAAAPGQAVTL
jgi:hypothetical protein